MAAAPKDPAEGAPKKKGKGGVILVAALVVLAAGGAGGFFMMKGGHGKAGAADATEIAKSKPPAVTDTPLPPLLAIVHFEIPNWRVEAMPSAAFPLIVLFRTIALALFIKMPTPPLSTIELLSTSRLR